jgi:hypothetical protein
MARTQPKHLLLRIGVSGTVALLFLLGFSAIPIATRADEASPIPVEVNEWSVWVGNPAQTAINASRVFRNAMPGIVGTSRPKLEEKELASRFPIAPVSVVQLFGDPRKDVDIELRAKKGQFLAHWPAGTERGGRLQWFKSDLSQAAPEGTPQSYLPDSHWFGKLRDTDAALFLKSEAHYERFIAYDTELSLPIPLKLRGGPDEYTLQNLTSHRLLDVALIAPTENGYRVGWLDELPAAVPEKDGDAKKKKDEAARKATDSQKAEGLFKDAESKEKDKEKDETQAGPLPAEGGPDVRARLDQILNRPVTIDVEKAPRKEVLDLIAGQARFRYELDDPTLAKAEVDIGESTTLKAAGIAARDALADVLGGAGLSYRVTETGSLFITTAARLADEAGKKGAVIEGPPVKLTLSQPLKPSNPSYRELTRDVYVRRLSGQGLRDEAVRSLLDQYGQALFEPRELIVLAHFSREALDETVILDVFPPPKKLARVALLAIHGIDPRLQDRARVLVKQLGDASSRARESAESLLLEMGPVAVPVLEDALGDKDIEIVFRAERLLLKLNRAVP